MNLLTRFGSIIIFNISLILAVVHYVEAERTYEELKNYHVFFKEEIESSICLIKAQKRIVDFEYISTSESMYSGFAEPKSLFLKRFLNKWYETEKLINNNLEAQARIFYNHSCFSNSNGFELVYDLSDSLFLAVFDSPIKGKLKYELVLNGKECSIPTNNEYPLSDSIAHFVFKKVFVNDYGCLDSLELNRTIFHE